MKIFKWWLIFISLPMATLMASAQQVRDTRIHSDPISGHTIKNYDWRTVAWTGNNTPYHHMRIDIDRLLAHGQKADVLERKYGALAKKDFYNPQFQFRWAYVARKAALAIYPFNHSKINAPINAMDGTIKPNTYDWIRLRFLLAIEMHHAPDLIPIGERLLHHAPNDLEVKYEFVGVLMHSSSITDRRKAVSYAQSLLKLSPKHAAYHSSLAAACRNLWMVSQNPIDGNRALLEYNTYLKLAPLNAPLRKDVEFWIKNIQRCRTKDGHYHYTSYGPK